MSEDNLALTISADPQLKKQFSDRTLEPDWEIPKVYEREIRAILDTQVSLLPNIDSPEDYRKLVAATDIIKACKERLAVVRHHLKALNFRWTKCHKQATKYLETKYYVALNNVRQDTKKAIIISALEPITSGVDELTHLLDLAEMAHYHLNDVNWAVKNSNEMITSYFAAIKSVAPSTVREV